MRITGKMRSDEVKVETRLGAGKTGDGDKWKHDKFSEAAGEEEEQGEDNFSKHWSRRFNISSLLFPFFELIINFFHAAIAKDGKAIP